MPWFRSGKPLNRTLLRILWFRMNSMGECFTLRRIVVAWVHVLPYSSYEVNRATETSVCPCMFQRNVRLSEGSVLFARGHMCLLSFVSWHAEWGGLFLYAQRFTDFCLRCFIRFGFCLNVCILRLWLDRHVFFFSSYLILWLCNYCPPVSLS